MGKESHYEVKSSKRRRGAYCERPRGPMSTTTMSEWVDEGDCASKEIDDTKEEVPVLIHRKDPDGLAA